MPRHNPNLASYLNDHLAGSVAALSLLKHLIKAMEGTPHACFFEELRGEIAADQAALEALLAGFGEESRIRKAAGWIAEKIGQVKVQIDGQKFGELGLLEALEMLALGITGKRMLWAALGSAFKHSPLLSNVDLAFMEQRAVAQLERVEAARVASAVAAFAEEIGG